jgi:hypothetical protein
MRGRERVSPVARNERKAWRGKGPGRIPAGTRYENVISKEAPHGTILRPSALAPTEKSTLGLLVTG